MSTRYTITIRPHDRSVSAEAGRSILDAALGAGLNLPHSCKSGHCGSCRARLVAGTIEYPGTRPLGLTEDEAAAGYVLTCQARARSDLTLEARLIAAVTEVEIKTLPCRIERLQRLAPDVMQVFLRLPSVERMAFQAGQYLDVLTADGRRHSFSVASPPHDSGLIELHVRRSPRGRFTGPLFASTAPGALLTIEGPLGHFIYRDGSRPAVLIAGGTGFAPLKAMLRHALERGTPRELHLYWGARTAPDVYEQALVREWVRSNPRLRFTPVLSEANAVASAGERLGWVHEAVLADYPSLQGFEVYVAGPPALIEAARATFPARGLAPDDLCFDSFDYPE